MVKSAREQLQELEEKYKATKKTLGKQVRVDEAKELSGLFDTTLNQAVESLRASVAQGLGAYHRNLKSVVVRVSVDAKNVTTVKNTIRTIRMTPKEIEAWDKAHVEPTRAETAEEMFVAIQTATLLLDEYHTETARLVEAQESETPEAPPEEGSGSSVPAEPVGAVA